jgi:hypothetical protein
VGNVSGSEDEAGAAMAMLKEEEEFQGILRAWQQEQAAEAAGRASPPS